MEGKTIKEWLETMDLETATKAFSNLDVDCQSIHLSFHSALSAAFTWADTPQGHDFWMNISMTHLAKS